MKLFRYLAKEVMLTTCAISLILLLIIVSGRFVSYLGRAAEGKMSFEFLFIILGYHIPNFLQLILPLAFFLALLLTYGRLYIENEMSVLFSSGVSKLKLLQYTLGISLFATAINAFFSLWLTPSTEYQSQLAEQAQSQLTAFDFIQSGAFQGNGRKVTYVSSLTPEEGWMNSIFISDFIKQNGQNIPTQTFANYAEQIKIQDEGNSTYLVLKDGIRYEGVPGQKSYRVTHFDTYAILLDLSKKRTINDLSTVPSTKLWSTQQPLQQAEWQWRLSLILMIPILTVLATSLSQVNPRQGRFFKLLPATILMILYLGMLIWGKGAIEKEEISMNIGLWGVHTLFALVATILFLRFNNVSITSLYKKQISKSKRTQQ